MPIIGSFASGGGRGFGGLRTYAPPVPPQTYFISYDTAGSANLYLNSNITDSDGNLYTVGQWTPTSNGYIAKYNSSGVGQWYRRFYENEGSPYDWGGHLATTSTDEIWITHTTDLSGANSPALSKVNKSTGQFLSTTFLRSASGGNNYTYGDLAVDSSNNFYITGQGDYDGSGFKFFTCKFNSSGVLQWQRRYYTGWSTGYTIAVDSSANSYQGGLAQVSGINNAFLAKRNSSGTNQWQSRYLESGGAGVGNYIYDIKVDSNDNTYFTCLSGTAGSYTSHLVKINNSDGAIVWQRKISGTPSMVSLTIDTVGNIYVAGSNGSTTTLLMKYNSSGTLQWTRTITNSISPNRIRWKNNSLYLTGQISNGSYQIGYNIKVPDDGSKTGTYTNGGITHVYAVGSISDTAGTLTTASGGTTDDAGSMSVPSHSMANISASPTRYNTVI